MSTVLRIAGLALAAVAAAWAALAVWAVTSYADDQEFAG